MNTDILTLSRAVMTSIPLCDIDANVSVSPLCAANSIRLLSLYSTSPWYNYHLNQQHNIAQIPW